MNQNSNITVKVYSLGRKNQTVEISNGSKISDLIEHLHLSTKYKLSKLVNGSPINNNNVVLENGDIIIISTSTRGEVDIDHKGETYRKIKGRDHGSHAHILGTKYKLDLKTGVIFHKHRIIKKMRNADFNEIVNKFKKKKWYVE